MEFFAGIIALGLLFLAWYVGGRVGTKLSGVENKPLAMDPDEISMDEISHVKSDDFSFKSIVTRDNRGRLVFTSEDRIAFTSINGKQTALLIHKDQVRDFSIQPAGIVKPARLTMTYVADAGEERTATFLLRIDPLPFEKFDPNREVSRFEDWISVVNAGDSPDTN